MTQKWCSTLRIKLFVINFDICIQFIYEITYTIFKKKNVQLIILYDQYFYTRIKIIIIIVNRNIINILFKIWTITLKWLHRIITIDKLQKTTTTSTTIIINNKLEYSKYYNFINND